MQIKVTRPVSLFFYAESPCDFIVYTNGKMYLEKHEQGRVKINLPISGKYEVKTRAQFLEQKPIEKTVFWYDLPKPDRDVPFNIKKFFLENNQDSPARNYKSKGIITVNKKFMSLPIEQRMYILLHEAAHHYYSEEILCDLWALNEFLEMGFNGSQAFLALFGVLNCDAANPERKARNEKRIKEIYNELKDTKYES